MQKPDHDYIASSSSETQRDKSWYNVHVPEIKAPPFLLGISTASTLQVYMYITPIYVYIYYIYIYYISEVLYTYIHLWCIYVSFLSSYSTIYLMISLGMGNKVVSIWAWGIKKRTCGYLVRGLINGKETLNMPLY